MLFKNSCDVCVIVTGDTDLLPAVRTCQKHFIDHKIVFAVPCFRNHSRELMKVAPGSFKMNYTQYIKFQLPNPVKLADGIVIGDYYLGL